jgi:outer membrane receptor protein involved in Fe transport
MVELTGIVLGSGLGPLADRVAVERTVGFAEAGLPVSGVKGHAGRFLFGKIGSRLIYTRTLQRDDYLDPAFPKLADQVLLELGDPKDAFNWNVDYTLDKFRFGYQMRYIGRMVVNFAEDFYSVNGDPPENADWAYRRNFPAVMYHDVRAGYDFTDAFSGYIGIDNVKDKVPPLGLTATGAGSGIYEARGRYVYAGVKWTM